MNPLPGTNASLAARAMIQRKPIRLVIALLWLLACNVAQAASDDQACGLSSGVQPPLQMTTDATLVATAGIGEVLHRFKRVLPLRRDSAECSGRPYSIQLSPHRRLAPGLYDSGVAGIGLRLLLDGSVLHANGDGRRFRRPIQQIRGELTVELVKLGPLAGTIELNAAEWPMLLFESADGTQSSIPFAGKVRLLSSTCRTPDVRVDLGETSTAELIQQGASRPQSFQLALHDCPAGLTNIQYQLDPIAPVIDAARGIVGMDERATAGGAGVQISDASGQSLAFSQALVLDQYRSASGSDYRIPLQARIVVPAGQNVQAGRVSTVINVTIIYE